MGIAVLCSHSAYAEVGKRKAFECFFQLGKQKCKSEMALG